MARTGVTKYTQDRVKRIVDAIGVGATRTLACKYGGIHLDTLAEWERRYADFAAQVRDAEGRAAVGWLAKIEKAASDGTWQAAAWKLERLYPEQYGRAILDQRSTHLHLTAEQVAGMSDDELDRLHARLMRSEDAGGARMGTPPAPDRAERP